MIDEKFISLAMEMEALCTAVREMEESSNGCGISFSKNSVGGQAVMTLLENAILETSKNLLNGAKKIEQSGIDWELDEKSRT